MSEIIFAFERIDSETTLKTFIDQFGLTEISRSGNNAIYEVTKDGSVIRVNEHCWDPSQVFNSEKEIFTVTLSINNTPMSKVRFRGDV